MQTGQDIHWSNYSNVMRARFDIRVENSSDMNFHHMALLHEDLDLARDFQQRIELEYIDQKDFQETMNHFNRHQLGKTLANLINFETMRLFWSVVVSSIAAGLTSASIIMMYIYWYSIKSWIERRIQCTRIKSQLPADDLELEVMNATTPKYEMLAKDSTQGKNELTQTENLFPTV
jgi:hypothetical protein